MRRWCVGIRREPVLNWGFRWGFRPPTTGCYWLRRKNLTDDNIYKSVIMRLVEAGGGTPSLHIAKA